MARVCCNLAFAVLALMALQAAGHAQEEAAAQAPATDEVIAGDMTDYLPGRGAWLQYRGDLSNTGVSHSRPIDWSKVQLAWTYFAGGSLTATPAFAKGRVIAADELGVVHCVDGKTGKGLWTRRCGPGGAGQGFVVSSPMILDGRIYIAAKMGVVYCLDFETGEILWEFPVTELEADGRPARIYSSCKGDARGVVFSTTGGRTWCLDPLTGKARWHLDLFRETGSSAAVLGSNVYVASKDRLLREVDFETGEVRRKIDLPGTTHSTPALGLGYAYMITFRKTFAVDLTQMAAPVVWEGEATTDDKLCGTVGNGRVYFPLGQYVYAQDGPSGKTLWKHKAGHKVGPSVLLGDDLCFASQDKTFSVLDTKTGDLKFQINLGEGFHAGPIIVDGTVYLVSDVNTGVRVFALREMDGEGVDLPGGGKPVRTVVGEKK